MGWSGIAAAQPVKPLLVGWIGPLSVPMAAAQAYDTAYLLTYAILNIRNGDLSGPAVKAALENMPRLRVLLAA